MSTKHTPRPWIYSVEDETIEREAPGGPPIAAVFGVDDYPCLDPDDHDIEAVRQECIANGRVLAAAPDLLEACEAALNADRPSMGDSTHLSPKVSEILVAAVTKAKGES